jgi:DNA-binding transcriptional ArsR family regulator
LELKKLLASSLRQKILKSLSERKEINVMGLVRRINSTYNEVNRNLTILEREGIITDARCGRMRLIRLNRENPKTVLLLQVLKQLEYETGVAVSQVKK